MPKRNSSINLLSLAVVVFTLSGLLLSTFLVRNSVSESLTLTKQLSPTDQHIISHTQHRQAFDPFSDFTFRAVNANANANANVNVNHTQNPDTNKEEYFSSYHCVSTGTIKKGKGQSERLSYLNWRPNFINRQCHYVNLYYRISDQTFHYLASPKETKVWKEARNADAQVGYESESKYLAEDQDQLKQHHLGTILTNELQGNINHYKLNSFPRLYSSYMEIINRMNVQIGHANDNTKVKREKLFEPWRPIVHEHDHPEDLWETIASASLLPSPPKGNANATHDETASFAVVDIKSNQDANDADRKDFYMTLYKPYHSMNIGHLLWDDLLSIYGLYDRLIAYNNKLPSENHDLIVPFFVELPDAKRNRNYGGPDPWYRCSPKNRFKWKGCTKTFMRLYQDFTGVAVDQCSGDLLRTGNWLRGDKPIGVWKEHAKDYTCLGNRTEDLHKRRAQKKRNRLVDDQKKKMTNVDLVMLPNVLAGGGRMGYFACMDDCTLGRSKEYYRFRNYLIDNILSAEEKKVNDKPAIVPNDKGTHKTTTKQQKHAGYIVFSLPFGSSRPEQVANFTDEIQESIQRYGTDLVKVVELPKMTIQDQVRLLEETALLITNHGGIGSASIFLPRGASVIVYWHGDKKSDKKDHHWYESAGYFRSIYVGVDERPFLNRTMAILDDELEKTRIEWAFQEE